MSGETMLDYRRPELPLSWWAIGSLALSIVCALGCFLIVPPMVGLLVTLLIRNGLDRETRVRGQGMAAAAVRICGWAIPVGLVTMVMMPSLGRERGPSNRSVCAANLRGTTQSMNVYAADYNDAYPIISSAGGYSLAAGGGGVPSVDVDASIRSMYGVASPSVTQNMWLLTMTGQVAPKQFICKSDPAPLIAAGSATDNRGCYLTNFNNSSAPSDFAYSYSFTYPWETTPGAPVGSWWKNQTDAALPLMADMAPFVGTGTPAANPTDASSRNANSFNHQRDGQNVGYGDAHAEFVRNPATGHKDDNIYTFNGGIPSRTGTPHNGTVPGVGAGGAAGNYDICMVPAADGVTFVRR